MTQVTISYLSQSQRQLVELMQNIHFGHISHITVHNGEPELTSETIIEREVKLGGQTPQDPATISGDFILKKEVLTLFAHIARMNNGVIRRLEIKHGLPFLMRIWERAA